MLGYTADNNDEWKNQNDSMAWVDALLEQDSFFLDIREDFELANWLMPKGAIYSFKSIKKQD